ncbi:MAG: response regulator [Anaerolineae bacterium]|nr:response regulator [Anaerolineae bacterium]
MNLPPLILTVASNQRNLELLNGALAKAGFHTHGVDTLTGLDGALEQADNFALALVDLTGFDSSIWERCERLRHAGVPFLVISPYQSADLQRESLRRGARGVLVKPLRIQDVLQLVHALASA